MNQRIIKFRAWEKRSKQMEEVDGANLVLAKGKLFEAFYEGNLHDVSDNYEVMQFTGLKDKNGKEIYEGDICEYEEPMFESGVFKSPVIFLAGAFGLDGSNGNFNPSFYQLGKFAQNGLEVIGNIYENPELLKI